MGEQLALEGVTSNSTTTAAGEVAPPPRWAASRHGAVAMCELADRLHNTLHSAAGNHEDVRIMLSIVQQSQSLTEADVNGGAGVLRPRTELRR
jgi:hypothetical protein